MPAVYVAASTSERLHSLRAALIVQAPVLASLEHARAMVDGEADVTMIIDAHVSWGRAFLQMLPEASTCSVVIAAADEIDMAEVPELLREGADGFVIFPSDPLIVATAIEAARQTRARRRGSSVEIVAVRSQLMKVAEDFRFSYQRERARSRELAAYLGRIETSYRDTVRSLANAVEAKDPTTGAHIERVTDVGVALARIVDPDLAAQPYLSFGFLLHDVGKIGVPDEVLRKPGPLTDSEAERMHAHAQIGAHIVGEVEFLAPVRPIIRHHHERWDGLGYPDGLAGEDIPKAARIFAVADAADAMLHDRPYRKALSLAQARDEITKAAGTQFDPAVVQAFIVLSEAEDTPLRALSGGDASR
jgi:HD-GYP domain-containing protein (c-di-GMP phosphodiesterase class II)